MSTAVQPDQGESLMNADDSPVRLKRGLPLLEGGVIHDHQARPVQCITVTMTPERSRS